MIKCIDAADGETPGRIAAPAAEIRGGAIVPPKPEGITNKAGISAGYAPEKQSIDHPAPHEPGAINPFGTFATPVIAHAGIAAQPGHEVIPEQSRVTM